jgi:Phosphotransferase enzyme family
MRDTTLVRLARAGRGREVWRVGNTVRRPTGPWSPTVHALLRHLESVGFDGAPRVLGVDDHGREILTYIPGEGGWDGPWSDEALTEAAGLIRRYHDSVASFTPPPGSVWHAGHQPDSPATGTVIVCHNDLGPPNTVYVEGRPRALIDWDLACPAPASWDLTSAAWRYVPLYTDDDCARINVPVLPRGPRLRLFCDAYGLDDRGAFVEQLRARLLAMESPFARHSISYLDANRATWERALT